VAEVVVSPATFANVEFDAGEIQRLTEGLAADVGLPDDLDIRIEIDESVPTGRTRVTSQDPVVIEIESGALEDPQRLRRFSAKGAARVLGRVLLQVGDLRNPQFGDPPTRDELSFPLRSAWDVYAMGRLDRLGHTTQKQRWLYAFRTRHGFSDAADRAFDQLWGGAELSWADIEEISGAAQELTPGRAR
jgi:hypothetical protein